MPNYLAYQLDPQEMVDRNFNDLYRGLEAREVNRDRQTLRTLNDLRLKDAQLKMRQDEELRTRLASARGRTEYVRPEQPMSLRALDEVRGMGVTPSPFPQQTQPTPVTGPTLGSVNKYTPPDLAGITAQTRLEQGRFDEAQQAVNLTEQMALNKAKIEAYGDKQEAAKIDETIKKMELSGKMLEYWEKLDPSGELARQQIAANPELFPNFDPSKYRPNPTGPSYFDAPDGGSTFFDGKVWKHIPGAKPMTEPRPQVVNPGGVLVGPDGTPIYTNPKAPPATGGGNGGGGSAPRSFGKAPSGYRYSADGSGNLEPIPGGPAALKAEAALQSREKARGAYDASIAVVDKLLAHPGRSAGTGLSSKVDPRNYVPGTDAYDFQRELESFDSVLFLSNIEKMKGMGALSNAEGARVSAAAGAIKPGMQDKTFVNNLNIIKEELRKAKDRIENGNLLLPYANQQNKAKPASKGGKSTKAQQLLNKYRK